MHLAVEQAISRITEQTRLTVTNLSKRYNYNTSWGFYRGRRKNEACRAAYRLTLNTAYYVTRYFVREPRLIDRLTVFRVNSLQEEFPNQTPFCE